MQLITGKHGCSLPRGDVVAMNSLDTFQALCDDLSAGGVSLELIEESAAIPLGFTLEEAQLFGAVWLAPQLRDRGG